MAYAKRFNCDFQDLNGTPYTIEILEKDYVGSSSNVLVGAGGFRLTYSGTNRGVFNYVMGSKVSIPLQITTATEKLFIRDLATNDDKHFLVNIKKNGAQFWTGFVLSDLVSFEDAPFPFTFDITAADGFGFEGKTDYTNSVWNAAGEPSDVYRTFQQLLNESLSNIGIFPELTSSTPLMIGESFIVDDNQQNLGLQSKVDTTRVNANAFVKYDTNNEETGFSYNTNLEVIEEVCRVFNARLFQWDGRFWFIPITLFLDSTAKFYQYGANGIIQGSETINLFDDEDQFNRFVGGSFDFYPPLKKACVNYNYFYNPVATPESNTNPCGVNNVATEYNIFKELIGQSYTNYGDHNLQINLGYRYEMQMHDGQTQSGSDNPTPDPHIDFAPVWKFKVTSSSGHTLVNDVVGVGANAIPVIPIPTWKKNGEADFIGISGTTIDISSMDCFGLPETDAVIKVYKNGELQTISSYSKTNEEITLSSSFLTTDSIQVIFDYVGEGIYYVHIPDFDENFQMTDSTSDMVLDIPFPPESGSISVLPTELGTDHIEGYLTSSAATTWGYDVIKCEIKTSPFGGSLPIGTGEDEFMRCVGFKIISFDVVNTLKAQPTNSSASYKACQENNVENNDSVSINMITGDKSEFTSDSNIQVLQSNGQYTDSTNWTIDFQDGTTFSGNIADVVAKTYTYLQQTPVIRYNGNIKGAGSHYFDIVKGMQLKTFNDLADNVIFGGGSFIAAEAEWQVQLFQFGK
jgi:hypothetical protein